MEKLTLLLSCLLITAASGQTDAEALIAERGLGGLSIAEVVRRARSSVGSFYGRFGDKDGLLRALHARAGGHRCGATAYPTLRH